MRTYDHLKYPRGVKEKLRQLCEYNIKRTHIDQVAYFLPSSLVEIDYYYPFISSYMTEVTDEADRELLISQFIIIRLQDLFIDNMLKLNRQISFKFVDIPIIVPDNPYGLYQLNSIIPEDTCYTLTLLLSNLLPESDTKDVKFSFTNNYEEWGDIPPKYLSCLNSSLYNDLTSKGVELSPKKSGTFSKVDTINISCSNDTMNKDIIFIFLDDAEIFGQECYYYCKKFPLTFKQNVKKGTIMILKKDAYYNWAYTVNGNKSFLILK